MGFLIGIILILAIAGIVVSSNRKREEENKEASNSKVEAVVEEELNEEDGNKVAGEGAQEDALKTEEPEKEVVSEPEEPEESEEPQSQVVTTPKVEAIPGQHRDPNSAVVVIDPGHQAKGDSTKEPNGPGSSNMKARVTWGTTGVSTGVAEYVLNLDISLKLKTELENRGYTVYMTRSTHDVNISNMERAQYATSVGADIAVRIHANSISNSSVAGAETLAPSSSNAYVSHLANASQSLSQKIIDAYCSATGFKNRGVKTSDTMTGINWSEVPVTIIELGFMSNAAEDQAMQDPTMQNNMVQGIANGIDAYFGF
ncbi:MAG: N-acetylmuramoyl-L-alanine amidase [Tyzzerella sp.]|nr:N-acetylmuramoyl-L-alanine amidase [Tyzzerella sp.]